MRQKVFSILALLCLMVSGASADPQEELLTTVTATGQTTYTQTVEGIVTVTPDVSDYYASGGWYYQGSVNVEPFSDEYTITRCVFKNSNESLEDDFAPFIVTMWDNTASVETKNGVVSKDMGIKTIEVYGYKNSAPEPEPAGQNYDLTLADGSDAHGTVTFSVGGAAVTQAKKDDVVTVTVTPENGYSTKDASVRAYTSWGAANARRRAPGVVGEVAVTKNETDGTWSFTMPEANVWVVVTYTKDVQDSWIQNIDDQTWTGEAIEPAVTVQDGSAVLTLGTDYTVAYSNNVNTGAATVTVTGMGDYSGTATKTFTIVADKTALQIARGEAEAYHFTIHEGHPEAAAVLMNAILAAYETLENPYASQEEVNDALSALTTAMTTAQQAVLAETKTALNNAIAEGQAYYVAIVGSNPDAANDLLDAIAYAQGVLYNTDATQEQVENALSALTTAISNIVAATRVTITIPAKSYVARIDADKRQIETAVAGVKLYSVKSVTNTEVELTGELSVIAAEMPYFIYNDNDTEVEVSIIVSSEEADNVDYDSEHFKGTLVDKTFTDEDMEEADHYVLSGGSSFVWVKDAGVLSAGKCWIELTQSPNNARALSIVFDGETTGISTAKTDADTEDAAVYDLQGRRVMQPTKGLFIVNGKKVVIK